MIHYGFAGFENEDGILRFNPVLPKGWTSINYNFFYMGQKVNVNIDRENITLLSDKGNSTALELQVNDQALVELMPGEKHSASYKKMGNHYYTYNELGVQIKKEMQHGKI